MDLTDTTDTEQPDDDGRAREAIRWLMKSSHGRWLARNIFAVTATLQTTGPADTATMAYAEGRRSIGNEFARLVLEYAPEHFTELFTGD